MASNRPDESDKKGKAGGVAEQGTASCPQLGSPCEPRPARSSPAEISIKDFFDFMKTAYQVYECVEGGPDEAQGGVAVDWEELEKNTVVKMLMDNKTVCSDDISTARRGSEGGVGADSSDMSHCRYLSTDYDAKDPQGSGKAKKAEPRRNSFTLSRQKYNTNRRDSKTDPEEAHFDSILKTKLSDVLNEGILDSVLPYMVGYSKPAKTVSSHQPIIKKPVSFATTDLKKPASFGGFVTERESKEKLAILSRDKLGQRKSSIGEKTTTKTEGEVEIHVCDEVKGLKRDFRCPQKLLVSKMGYFADVTSGQKLEDMDISVHCDIQIFDWLMRWVKKDTILVADWPLLDPTNVVPILVSASFLQMDPLLHDCLMYCHGHMTAIVRTNTNLACLNDTILTRLGAMYTNTELEAIKDKKDKIQSRLFCKMIMSLGEPVPETLRGHYSSLATLFKCSKCSKLIPRQIADRVPCQASSMSIDRRGYVISAHSRDIGWNLSEYIVELHTELKSWRKVYWRLWGESHFLRCTECDNYFSVHQMEWCCYHAEVPQFFSLEPARPICLPIGRYPCCSERAYRYQSLQNCTQGCRFREHTPEQKTDQDVAVLGIYTEFKDVIFLPPPQLIFPERLTRLVARAEGGDDNGRLAGREVFWWEGLRLAPARQQLGLLGKLYCGSPTPKPGPVVTKPVEATATSSKGNARCSTPATTETTNIDNDSNTSKITISSDSKEAKDSSKDSSSDAGENESDSSSSEETHSEESSPRRTPPARRTPLRAANKRRPFGGARSWAPALSARSNQDHQRQYEERAARQMRTLLARRAVQSTARQAASQPLGGSYVRLEAEWRESTLPTPANTQRASRHLYSTKPNRSKSNK